MNKFVCICVMKDILNIIKGVHFGKFIERELNQRQFAVSIKEHPQTLNAIIKGKRSINIDLSFLCLQIGHRMAVDITLFSNINE